MTKSCKTCGSTTRALKYPGPRCLGCHREVTKMRKASAHESRVQKVYGLGPGQYQELYRFQGGRCFICQRATGASRRLSVDHDHKTGKVRGLLCRPCNDVLGHLRDDSEAFMRGYSYLTTPPAQLLEIDAVHEDKRACDECKHPMDCHGPNQGCLKITRGSRCSCAKHLTP